MGQHHGGQAPNTETAQLVRHVGLGRALVHEDSSLGSLDQRGIALAHIEERDAQARRRSPDVVGPQRPAGEREREKPGNQDAESPARPRMAHD
jgi:hypothetical protein